MSWRQYQESCETYCLLMFFSLDLHAKSSFPGEKVFQILISLRREYWVFPFFFLDSQSQNVNELTFGILICF